MMDAKTVLVPLDGSAASESILGYAQALAAALQLPLQLLAVVPNQQDRLSAEAEELAQRLGEQQFAEATRYLEDVSERLSSTGSHVRREVSVGEPAEAILRVAARRSVAAVAMATHGRGGVERLVIGSVADKVMRRCKKPILLMCSAAPAVPAPLHFQRIAVPLDGTRTAKAALAPASQVLASGGELLLVKAEPLLSSVYGLYAGIPDVQTGEQAVAAEAHQELERVRQSMPAAMAVRTLVVRGFPERVLPQVLERRRVDLVVMCTHGYGGMRRFLIGSVADTLVRSGLPVLLLRAKVGAGVVGWAPPRPGSRADVPALTH